MFKVIELDWQKRRMPGTKKKVKTFEVNNFKKERNHFCEIVLTYEDGTTKELVSRVVQNPVNGSWVVDGMHFAVRLIED